MPLATRQRRVLGDLAQDAVSLEAAVERAARAIRRLPPDDPRRVKAMMRTALDTSEPRPGALVIGARRHTAATILDAWRAGKSPNTLCSYRHDLEAFARFLSTGLGITPALSIDAALERLFREDSARAHGLVLRFRAALLAANLAPATVNRALATLRSVSAPSPSRRRCLRSQSESSP